MSSEDGNSSTKWILIIIGVIVVFALGSVLANQYRNNQQVNDSINEVNQSLTDLNDSIIEFNEQEQAEPVPEETDPVTPAE